MDFDCCDESAANASLEADASCAANIVQPDLSKKQFLKNLISNLLGFGLGIVSSFFLTPYWIKCFGVVGYGLVPLTNNLVGYFSLFTVILSSSISRFVTIEAGRGNYERANRIFNTSLWTCVFLSAMVSVIGGIASFYTQSLINVPEGFEADSQYMFLFATATFILSLLQTPFNVAMFYANRIDLSTWINVIMRAIQIIVSVGLVATIFCNPTAVMVATFVTACWSTVAAIYYWKRLMPWSRIIGGLDYRILYEQLSFGIWNFIHSVGGVLYLQIDLLVVNLMLGPAIGGQYAALMQWPFLIRSLGGTISVVFGPSILHYYAQNNIAGVVNYTCFAMRTIGLFLALPISLICGLAKPLLTQWLGPDYSGFHWLLVLMTFHLCVYIVMFPLYMVQNAVNRVKTPAIMTCIMGIGNAILAVALTHYFDIYGVAIAGVIMLTARNIILGPLYTSHILGCRWYVFWGEIVKVLALTSVVTAIGLVACHILSLATWPRLMLTGMAIGLIYCIVVWFVFITSQERTLLRERLLAPALTYLRH